MHRVHQTPVKSRRSFFADAIVSGLLVVVPIYLTGVLLSTVVQSLHRVLKPIEIMIPDLPFGEYALALLFLLLISFLVGIGLRTSKGKSLAAGFQRKVLARVPGYSIVQGLTQQFAGTHNEKMWKPALAVIEDALVPAFIVEELDDGRYTVYVPSVPTPLTGSVYILSRERVHPLDIPFSEAAMVVARWGCGSKDLVAAMKTGRDVKPPGE